MTTTRQPKGVPVGGQFAPDTHTESALTLNSVPMTKLEAGFKEARRLQQEKMAQLTFEMAATSAAAIAARTKAMHPTARYAVFHTDDQQWHEFRPYAVLDADRNELVIKNWLDPSNGFHAWADGDGDEDPESIHMLANDLEDHGGKLDGILSEKTAGPGANATIHLDLDKALEIS
ncbi:hypothetical protein [Arthrobacter sp. UYCo732]|uniref:hypothetical protein n=1 Tax=Arthrobacter sp. UYCo732 TaxID=3156336 RepID=UPI0033960F53